MRFYGEHTRRWHRDASMAMNCKYAHTSLTREASSPSILWQIINICTGMNFYFRRLFVLRRRRRRRRLAAGSQGWWHMHRWNEDPSTSMRACAKRIALNALAFADLWKVLIIWIRTQFALKNNIFWFYRIFRALLGWPSKYTEFYISPSYPCVSARESIKIIVNLYCRIESGKNRMKSANSSHLYLRDMCVSLLFALCVCTRACGCLPSLCWFYI